MLLVLLGSCITSRNINYLQKPGMDIPSYSDTAVYTDYKLRVGDRIYIKVYSTDATTNAIFNQGTGQNEQLMSTSSGGYADLFTYLVDEKGNIQFPMIGDIQLLGQTARAASDSIEIALKPIFKFSSVEIRIMNRTFSVIGNGNSAFVTMPQEKINIFKALALSGDVGIFDDRSKVRILRETDAGIVIKKFDLRSADIIHSEYFYIEPNDVIYIQPLNEQFFRITNVYSFISTAIASFSFGVLVFEAAKQVSQKPATE